MRRFLADRTRNRFDAASNTLSVSKIFDWYQGDFEKGHQGFTSLDATFARYADALGDTPQAQDAIRKGGLENPLPGLRLGAQRDPTLRDDQLNRVWSCLFSGPSPEIGYPSVAVEQLTTAFKGPLECRIRRRRCYESRRVGNPQRAKSGGSHTLNCPVCNR
jgi:hypothetical protein